jgi:aminopeptidase N
MRRDRDHCQPIAARSRQLRRAQSGLARMSNHKRRSVSEVWTGVGCIAALCGAGACADPYEGATDEVDSVEQELHEPPTPGSAGIGDVLFPTLGNGGYDVQHYHLDLRYATSDPAEPLDGTVTILARATQSLSQFDLDFAGESVGSVTVNGIPADFTRDGEELVITPPYALRRGHHFFVTVHDFVAVPEVASSTEFLSAPFFITPDGTAWANQPHNAHRIYPCNDHPRDMAAYSFRLDVPDGTTAVANGVLLWKHTGGGRTVWNYLQPEPMASELAQVAVGDWSVIQRGFNDGVRVRDVVPTRLLAELEPKLAGVHAQLDFLEERLGRYPFQSYGTLVADADLGFALETQTLSVYDGLIFTFPPEAYEPIMVHELAHQWFGDSVAPASWSDVWQSEGHATWYELTFQLDPDSEDFIGLAQLIYSLGDEWRAFFGPVAAPVSGDPSLLFNPNVYYGGALVLFALRQEVGDATFRQIERAWVRRNRGKSVSTDDFIALASDVADRDLTAFLEAWLYGDTTPPMPGYPEWVVDPVAPAAPAFANAKTAASVPMKSLPPLMRH